MIESKFPILEFDKDKDALINPEFMLRKHNKIHKHLVVCFFIDAIEQLLKDGIIEQTDTIKGENHCEVYTYKDLPVTLVPGKLGAPASAGFLEDFIALGAKYVMFCGGGGVLNSEITVGKFIVIDSAIRDEGMSYHYIEPSREIKADAYSLQKITDYLNQENVPYIQGKTWTTDAFYRETKQRIAKRKAEGAIIVEMEQSAMIAVSQFREIHYGAIIYGGDDVSKSEWDSRGWRNRHDVRLGLVKLCKDIVLTMSEGI